MVYWYLRRGNKNEVKLKVYQNKIKINACIYERDNTFYTVLIIQYWKVVDNTRYAYIPGHHDCQ